MRPLPLARVRCNTLQECRAYLVKVKPAKRIRKAKPVRLSTVIRRRVGPGARVVIVQLRKEGATFKQIADATGIALATCRGVIDSFILRANGWF